MNGKYSDQFNVRDINLMYEETLIEALEISVINCWFNINVRFRTLTSSTTIDDKTCLNIILYQVEMMHVHRDSKVACDGESEQLNEHNLPIVTK